MFKHKKGKILKIKRGYNPNSSSIGSIVFAVPAMLFIASIIFITSTTFVFSKYLKILKDKKNNKDGSGNQV